MQENATKTKRISGLDLIKIIATMLIVFHHYQQITKVTFKNINFDRGSFYFGYLVELFFLISGYVIAFGKRRNGIIKDLFHKLLRLYPMCIAAATAYCVAIWYFHHRYGMDVYKFSPEIIVKSFLLIYQPNVIALNNPSWYICVLIHCYLMWELIRLLTKDDRKKELTVSMILVVIFSVIKFLNFIPDLPVRGYIPFWIGVSLFHIRSVGFYKKGLAGYILLTVCATIGSICLGNFGEYYRILLVYMYWPLTVVLAIYISEALQVIDYRGWIEYCAGLSWIIYVWHAFWINVATWHAEAAGWRISSDPGYMILAYICIFAFAVIVDILVKTVKNRLKRKRVKLD